MFETPYYIFFEIFSFSKIMNGNTFVHPFFLFVDLNCPIYFYVLRVNCIQIFTFSLFHLTFKILLWHLKIFLRNNYVTYNLTSSQNAEDHGISSFTYEFQINDECFVSYIL